jgi:hypothetical protein
MKTDVVHLTKASYKHSSWVNLTPFEHANAVAWGFELWNLSQSKGLRESSHVTSKNMSHDIQVRGSIGEACVAKLLEIQLPQKPNQFKAPDLPFNIEVRSVSRDNYGLRVRDDDDDSRRVVCVVVPDSKYHEYYRVPGWLVAGQAKKIGYYWKPGGLGRCIYTVQQENLMPISRLKELIVSESCMQ